MRAFLTGAGGFVGSHLLRRLVGRGREVAILRRPGSDPRAIADVLGNTTIVEGDLPLGDAARAQLRTFAPEVVFHHGWGGVAGASRNDAAQVDNIAKSLDLVRASAEAGARVFVGLGSQAEYGRRDGAISEDAPTDPTSWYGTAKLATGLLSRRLASDLGIRFVWLRLFSAYGPGDHPSAMLPTLIRRLLDRERPALTAGTQLWDYLFIEDAAEAIELAATTPEAGGIYNLGSGRATAIREVVEQVRDLIDPSLPLGWGEVPFSPGQVMHLEADISRLRRDAGWAPRTDLVDGLRATVEWHRSVP